MWAVRFPPIQIISEDKASFSYEGLNTTILQLVLCLKKTRLDFHNNLICGTDRRLFSKKITVADRKEKYIRSKDVVVMIERKFRPDKSWQRSVTDAVVNDFFKKTIRKGVGSYESPL